MTQNVAASVRQRLLNRARATDRPFAELLQYYAMERFLYRLSVSEHWNKFVLKGALMLRVWHPSPSRPTMDIDVLGQLQASEVAAVVADVSAQAVETDGLVFDASTLVTEAITEDAEYEGVRVRLRGYLGTARVILQLDVGFGDVAFTEEGVDYPTLLDFPAPGLRGYSRESSIAEKFEAMVHLGLLNSRMKDFYDVWLLSRHFSFEGVKLAQAVQQTFERRGSLLQEHPTAFAAAFGEDPSKVVQWRAFLRKGRIDHAPTEFAEVVEAVRTFLEPVANTLVLAETFAAVWTPHAGWQKPES